MSAKAIALDAPLMPAVRLRQVQAMAAVLEANGAYHNKQDAIRALFWNGQFGSFAVARFVDEAMAVAAQEPVAKVMGES